MTVKLNQSRRRHELSAINVGCTDECGTCFHTKEVSMCRVHFLLDVDLSRHHRDILRDIGDTGGPHNASYKQFDILDSKTDFDFVE